MTPIDLNATYLALVNEGADLFSEGDTEAALGVFWKAFRLRPAAPVVLFNIGRAMEELKDPETEDFYAAAASQGNVDALYQLAVLCGTSGRNEEAVGYLKAYLKRNPPEDKCTQWARNTIRQLCPSPLLVWSKGKRTALKLQIPAFGFIPAFLKGSVTDDDRQVGSQLSFRDFVRSRHRLAHQKGLPSNEEEGE